MSSHTCAKVQRNPVHLGFTLIELLVVLCVVLILVSMLLPAISMVRNAASKTSCAGRLRQVGMAAQQYAADNDGVFAPPGISSIPVPAGWSRDAAGLALSITFSSVQLLGQYDEITMEARKRNQAWPGGGVTFEGRDTIFHCPRDPRRNGGNLDNQSYGMNERLVLPFGPLPGNPNPDWGLFATTLSAQKNPSERVLFIETGWASFHPGWGAPVPVPMLSATDAVSKTGGYSTGFRNWVNWHTVGANVGFVDGHVRFAVNPAAESRLGIAKYGPPW